MAFAHHIHDWHWLHGAGRLWHQHVVAARLITLGSTGLVVALALLISSGGWNLSHEDRISTSDPPLSGQRGKPISALEQALKQAEIELGQTGTAWAKLQVARRAWAVVCALPADRETEYRRLLWRVADLLADPDVTDILSRDDQILKARVAVELAPRIDPIETSTQWLS